MGAALAEASRTARDVFDEVDEALGPEPVPPDARRPGGRAQADRECAARDHGELARRVLRLTRWRRRSCQRGELRRRAQPRRIFRLVRGRLLRSRDDREAAQVARAGDAAGGAGRAAARWRRCSAPISALAQKIADAAAQGEVCAVANDNDPTQVVISGHKGAIDRAIELAKEMGAKRAVPLPVSAPFHCPLMQPAGRGDARCAELRRARGARGAALRQRHGPAGDRSGHDPQAAGRAGDRHGPLARKRRQHGRRGVDEFVELGGKVLGRMVKRIAPDAKVTSVVTIEDIEALAKEIA